jgi:hypothetical protein
MMPQSGRPRRTSMTACATSWCGVPKCRRQALDGSPWRQYLANLGGGGAETGRGGSETGHETIPRPSSTLLLLSSFFPAGSSRRLRSQSTAAFFKRGRPVRPDAARRPSSHYMPPTTSWLLIPCARYSDRLEHSGPSNDASVRRRCQQRRPAPYGKRCNSTRKWRAVYRPGGRGRAAGIRLIEQLAAWASGLGDRAGNVHLKR